MIYKWYLVFWTLRVSSFLTPEFKSAGSGLQSRAFVGELHYIRRGDCKQQTSAQDNGSARERAHIMSSESRRFPVGGKVTQAVHTTVIAYYTLVFLYLQVPRRLYLWKLLSWSRLRLRWKGEDARASSTRARQSSIFFIRRSPRATRSSITPLLTLLDYHGLGYTLTFYWLDSLTELTFSPSANTSMSWFLTRLNSLRSSSMN